MKQLVLTLVTMISLQQIAIAHEGHDKTPGSVAAPHGGVIKGTDQLYLELVSDTAGLKIYPLTHDTAPIPLKDISLQGTVSFPKKAKAENVTLTSTDDHFAAKVDAKGAYRYALDLVVTFHGKKEKVKFQVEPQGN